MHDRVCRMIALYILRSRSRTPSHELTSSIVTVNNWLRQIFALVQVPLDCPLYTS